MKSKTDMNPKVEAYINKTNQWQAELIRLREIILDCGLKEELKWGSPCYTVDSKNIALIGRFKNFCIISFVKGSLLSDPDGILEQQGENTQSARVIKFTTELEVIDQTDRIKSFLAEAIKNEKAGKKVEKKANPNLAYPEELIERFNLDSKFKDAFEALTPGRQNGYCLFFNAAKQSKTKHDRIEKYVARIFDGKGIHDCTCGLSNKMPNCDGSHKTLAK